MRAAEPRYVLQSPGLVENCVGLYVPLLEFNQMAKVMSDFDQYTILPNEDDFRLTRDGTHVSTGISYRVVGRNRERKTLDTRARVLLVWERVNDRWLICREEVTSLMSRSTVAR